MTRTLRSLLALSTVGLCMAQSTPLRPGTNSVPVRGVPQAIYYYPGGAGSQERPCVLFAPGDGGWRGFAVALARQVAAWGYDLYGLDTKGYLESFTGKTTLRENDVMTDLQTLADAVRGKRRVALIGWSEGAGLMALAAAAPSKESYAGLITMGLGDKNVLGWRLSDNLTYLTRKQPNEPAFSALSYMPKIAPVPLVMLQSGKDEYVGVDEAKRLFQAAADPKRLVLIEAQNHRFEGAQPEFFRQLREALEWTTAAAAKTVMR
jgi:pimeloyl-ACP methyl ester carboxylesterase